ncbi:MAG: DUF2232 domain-containing protein [Desulfitobacteriaceae bacterium]|nr:DUF2232 domain-containing protein [Desulfitobacteriaceae bacterium]MDI6914383.1 DUF2232 domain-containing protein [Desulfitobacteriaceae bacterium]
MYWSDRKSLDFLAGMAVIFFPLAGMVRGLWFLEFLLLLAVFWLGIQRGLRTAAAILVLGYGLAMLFYWPGPISYLPWVGLFSVFAWERGWTLRVNAFWSLLLAGLLGAIPVIGLAQQGLQPQLLHDAVNASMESYKALGMLDAAQQLGVSEGDLRSALEQMLPVYISLLPSLAALTSLFEYTAMGYLALRWIPAVRAGRAPFSHWRLPWYAVWGAILGLAAYLGGDEFALAFLKGLGTNLLVVYAGVALVLGLAVYVHFLRSPRIPLLLKWAMLFVNLFYFLFSIVAIVVFGLFDLVFNFRKLPDTSV